MIYKNYKDIKLSCLGMGNMRLPVKQEDPKHAIDYDKATEIIDYAMKEGINYYDTAYVYHNGESEVFLGNALVKRYPRDSFYITDKFNIMADPDYKKVFEEQLRRLQTDHIDFYLIHCLTDGTIDQLLSCGCLDYFEEQKRLGRITYFGFSTHASPATLKRFVDAHDFDFGQIQLNYFDYYFGHAKEEYEILKEKNLPIMVMESVRGGRLSHLTPETEERLKSMHKEWSISSWAFRFLQTLDQVQVCLSGMTTMDQIMDNVKTFSSPCALNDEEKEVLVEVVHDFRKQVVVPCTGCRYCTDGCPKQINIPEFLKLYNTCKVDGWWLINRANKIDSVGQPLDCINCKKCMKHCPQNIEIPTYLKELKEKMQK